MPAETAYVVRLRSDVPAAAIQWLDLKPNTSQRSLVYEKTPQTGYLLGAAQNDTLAALAANATVADYSGLAAYLIERGWAMALPGAPFEYHAIERIARSREVGVWGWPVDAITDDIYPEGSPRRR